MSRSNAANEPSGHPKVPVPFTDENKSYLEEREDELIRAIRWKQSKSSKSTSEDDEELTLSDIKLIAKDKCAAFLADIRDLPSFQGSPANTRAWLAPLHTFLDSQIGLEVIFESQDNVPVFQNITTVLPRLRTSNVNDSRRYARALVSHIDDTLCDMKSLRNLPASIRDIQTLYNTIKANEDQLFLDGIEQMYSYLNTCYSQTSATQFNRVRATLNSILPNGETFALFYLSYVPLLLISSARPDKRTSVFPLLVEYYKRTLTNQPVFTHDIQTYIRDLERLTGLPSEKLTFRLPISPMSHNGGSNRTSNSMKSKPGRRRDKNHKNQ